MSPKHPNELEDIEIKLLLEGIYLYYGFDFRNYAMASLKRRIWNIINAENVHTVSGLQEKVLHNPACMERFLLGLSVNVTSMFRDPNFYVAFRNQAIPLLSTYPFIRIWHAGCFKAVKKPQILPLTEIVPFVTSQIKFQVLI